VIHRHLAVVPSGFFADSGEESETGDVRPNRCIVSDGAGYILQDWIELVTSPSNVKAREWQGRMPGFFVHEVASEVCDHR
jgi:hypothetical protein